MAIVTGNKSHVTTNSKNKRLFMAVFLDNRPPGACQHGSWNQCGCIWRAPRNPNQALDQFIIGITSCTCVQGCPTMISQFAKFWRHVRCSFKNNRDIGATSSMRNLEGFIPIIQILYLTQESTGVPTVKSVAQSCGATQNSFDAPVLGTGFPGSVALPSCFWLRSTIY